jgi:hypothetical protein
MGVLIRFVLISALAKRYFVSQDFFGHYKETGLHIMLDEIITWAFATRCQD